MEAAAKTATVKSVSNYRAAATPPWGLRRDPLPFLLTADDPAVAFFARRDLLGEEGDAMFLREHPTVKKILRRRNPDGSFRHTGRRAVAEPAHHYELMETWKQLRFLVDQYELGREFAPVAGAAEFIFSCQSRDGDIRGMIGNQYATYYTGALLGLLGKAGFARDPRWERGLEWLLAMRQDDGGWAIPVITRCLNMKEITRLIETGAPPLEPDRSRPFGHAWTGMVLRAFAASPRHCRSAAARQAGTLLKSRFFQKDTYQWYESAEHWVRFQFPFWWNNLVAALDTLSLLGFGADDPDLARGLEWLIAHQEKDGGWKMNYSRDHHGSNPKLERERRPWVTLAICRILKRAAI